ncbi:MAG: hypothetical protein EA398_11425 [Deltaproteobacteria bacterium]|nr:MAG: hypothetical protein EA398_11425 [Deltaproteobacteria bacterium]
MLWLFAAVTSLFGIGLTFAVLFADAPEPTARSVESSTTASVDTGTPAFQFVPAGDPRLDHPAERGKFPVHVPATAAFVPVGDPRLDHPAERGKFPPP